MNVYKIELGRYTRRDKFECLDTFYRKSDMSQNEVEELYTKYYSALNNTSVVVTEIKDVEELVLETADGIQTQEASYMSYSDPVQYFDLQQLPKSTKTLVNNYTNTELKLKHLKEEIAKQFITIMIRPEVTQITESTVSVRGRFMKDLLLRIKTPKKDK